MITIRLRVNVSDNAGTISNATIYPQGNNVSADISTIVGNNKEMQLGNPFMLGRSVLGQGGVYVKELPYFLGSELSDSNGSFNTPYTLTVSGQDINSLVILFDTQNNAHPNTVKINDRVIYDDDPKFELALENTADSVTIIIDNWNKPNSPLIITGIYAGFNIDIDNTNLISFESNIHDRNNEKLPSFGLVSNTADLAFMDFSGDCLDLIERRILHSGIPIEATLVNDALNISEPICTMNVQDLTYDNDTRQVNLSLQDNIQEMQEPIVSELSIDILNVQSKTGKYYYDYLYEKTKAVGYDILSFDELDANLQNVLNAVTIQYPILENDTLWNEWEKLCELCLLHMYIDNSNKVVLKYNSGS